MSKKGEELLNRCFQIFSGSSFIDKETGFRIFEEYNKSPYLFCKKYDLLYENSAEEFSIAWMTWWNTISDYNHY